MANFPLDIRTERLIFKNLFWKKIYKKKNVFILNYFVLFLIDLSKNPKVSHVFSNLSSYVFADCSVDLTCAAAPSSRADS